MERSTTLERALYTQTFVFIINETADAMDVSSTWIPRLELTEDHTQLPSPHTLTHTPGVSSPYSPAVRANNLIRSLYWTFGHCTLLQLHCLLLFSLSFGTFQVIKSRLKCILDHLNHEEGLVFTLRNTADRETLVLAINFQTTSHVLLKMGEGEKKQQAVITIVDNQYIYIFICIAEMNQRALG